MLKCKNMLKKNDTREPQYKEQTNRKAVLEISEVIFFNMKYLIFFAHDSFFALQRYVSKTQYQTYWTLKLFRHAFSQ